jgi:hypothetical protein
MVLACLAVVFYAGAQTIAPPLLSAPANGGTGEPTTLTLSWVSTAGATTYIVVVSTVSTFANSVYDQQTDLQAFSAVASGLPSATTFYWRVDAGNGSSTSAWSAIWSFSTAGGGGGLAAPLLVTPANGAGNLPVTQTLSWGTVAGATSYSLRVSNSSAFAATIVNATGLTATTFAPTGLLLNGNNYYWEANAANGTSTSAWSSVWSFGVVTAVQPPAAPLLAAPTNNAVNQATSLTLSWNSTARAGAYAVELSTSSTFATTIFNQTGLTVLGVAATGLTASTEYFWRADAGNAAGTSAWSTAWSFGTAGAVVLPPLAPVLAAPANNAVNEPAALTISWNSAARAISYNAQIATVSSFASTVSDQTGLTALNTAINGLAAGTVYFWRVDAGNSGGTSAWSAIRTFTTTVPAPVLTSPAAGATGLGSSIALAWGTVAGASTYLLQVSTNYSFTTTIVNTAGITGGSRSMTGLANHMTYFWRVEAVSASGIASAWSDIAWFTVGYSAALSSDAARVNAPVFKTSHGIISYALNKGGPVQLAVFDLRGRTVFALSQAQSAGKYSINLANRSVAPGSYSVWFKVGSFEQRTAMVLSAHR